MSVAVVLSSVVGAFVLGTFVEYWGHRLMHMGYLLKKHHAKHHQHGSGQGWLGEFRDYGLPTLVFAALVGWFLPEEGLGLLIGGVGYAAIAAYAHQVQHEQPHLAWWMAQKQHTVHHYHREWHHNFGITVDWWDRVFGTYKQHEPLPMLGRDDAGFFDIHWASPSPPLGKRPTKRARG